MRIGGSSAAHSLVPALLAQVTALAVRANLLTFHDVAEAAITLAVISGGKPRAATRLAS